MAPSRRAFPTAATATMAAGGSDHATRSGARSPTAPTRPASSTTPTAAGHVETTAAPASGLDSKPAEVVVAGPRTGRQSALTFHLSGDPTLVSRLLDTAAHAGLPVSLFAVGRWLTEHPSLVQRILADGHELDHHTWSHPVLGRRNRVAVAAEIRRCRATLTGPPAAAAAPSGPRDDPPYPAGPGRGRSGRLPAGRRLRRRPTRRHRPGRRRGHGQVTAGLRPGSIVSLHTSHAGTIAALDPILATAHARGLQPVPLRQLLDSRPSPP
jgi:peptidoglycan/xylan/chitin deacetylase (PgdA/CDA1 family)